MKKPVKIVCIIDRSGSMSNIMGDMVGALNTFVKEQQKVDGEADFTLVAFDDRYELVFDQVELKKVPEIKYADVVPRGCTALYDSIGKTLNAIDSDDAIVLILTDGHENASREYKKETVKAMITEKQKKGWDISFVGADFDAYDTAEYFGTRSVNVQKNAQGMEDLTKYYVGSTTTYRDSR